MTASGLSYPFGDFGRPISPLYRRLREDPAPAVPVVSVTGDRLWLVTRYDLARRILADPRVSMTAALQPDAPRQEPVPMRAAGARGDGMSALRESGLHAVLMDGLGPRAVRRHEGWVRGRAEELMDGLLGQEPPADLLAHVVLPLSFAVAGKFLLGPVGEEDRRRLAHWCDTAFRFSGREPREQTDALTSIYQFFLDRAPSLVAAPGDHVLKRLVTAPEARGKLRPNDVAEVASMLLGAGYPTSSAFVSGAAITLLSHPEVLDAVRHRPGDTAQVVEELLRHTPLAVGGAKRVATEDVELDGWTLRAGECVVVSLESANNDPRAFPEPDAFRPGRPGPSHLAFSHGPHHCPGNRLARLQITTLTRLLASRPELRLGVPAQDITWREGVGFRIPEAVPVTW